MKSFFKEARRRKVFRMAALYIVGAWVVIQVAGEAFEAFGIPDAALRYIWLGALLGFPLALIFGWYYDITAQGIVHTPPAEPDEQIDLSLSRADYIIFSAFVVVVALITWPLIEEITSTQPQDLSRTSVSKAPPNSIAVLPFVNMSPDDGNEYFSDGISEELMNQLAALSDLKVAARKSSFYFKDRDEPIQQIANQLNVRNVLEGSVRKAGNRVRITAQLIKAETGYNLWSQSFDRTLENIFSVQEEIAIAIAQQLKVTLLNPSGSEVQPYRARNAEAYEQYLLGEFHRNKRSPNALEKAINHYIEAIELDNEFAPAFDSLAYTYLISAYYGNRSRTDAIELAQPYIQRALNLAPELAKIHATMGLVEHMRARFRFADEHFARAVELKPNLFRALNNWGLNLVLQSRLKEASAKYVQAQALDPLNDSINFNFGALLMLMGRFEEGARFLEKANEINPDRNVESGLATWSANYGHFPQAVEWGNRALQKNPSAARSFEAQSHVLVDLGMWEQASQLIERARLYAPDSLGLKINEADLLLQKNAMDGFYRFVEREFLQVNDDQEQPPSYIDKLRLVWYGIAKLLRGNNREAASHFLRSVGGSEGISAVTYDQMGSLKFLAIAYQRLERMDEANEVIAQSLNLVSEARENGWATPQLFVRLGEIYVLKGNRDAALEALAAAIEKGWREQGTLDHSLFWQPLAEDPEFLRLKGFVDDDLQQQRVQVERLGLIDDLTALLQSQSNGDR